jgi:hypothetical protein
MKIKGRNGWLITWAGTECEWIDRCKVVTILPSRRSEGMIIGLLPILYSSEYNHTLDDKLGYSFLQKGRDPFFKQTSCGENPAYCYGFLYKAYLYARRVKGLRCVRHDNYNHTLHWIENPTWKVNPDWNEADSSPENLSKFYVKMCDEREDNYTYSTKAIHERENAREAAARARAASEQ